MVHFSEFWKPEACGQTVLPDLSALIGQFFLENAKNSNEIFFVIFKCDSFGDFQTMWHFCDFQAMWIFVLFILEDFSSSFVEGKAAFLKTTRVEETAMQKMSLLVLKNWKNALETLQTLSAVIQKVFC